MCFSVSKVMDNFLGWRRKLLNWYRYFGYGIFYAAGFRIKIIGKQATRQEAPILVGAPHSSFLEVSSTVRQICIIHQIESSFCVYA